MALHKNGYTTLAKLVINWITGPNVWKNIAWYMMHNVITGRELRSGVKCIVVTIVTGSLWLVRRYRWGQVNLKTISTIPSH